MPPSETPPETAPGTAPETPPETPPGESIRSLMRRASQASLATSLRAGVPGTAPGQELGGWPYASLVLLAHDLDASPLLLISDLAEHSRNLKADPRLALLYDGTAGLDDPLTGARATILGRALPADGEPRLLARYLARQPSAALYAGFADFHLYRVEIERAHLVAGFGRIHWVEGERVRLEPAAPALAEAEADIVAHMNEDHAEAIQLYAERLLGLKAGGPSIHGTWRLTGVDPEGCDLMAGAERARLDFDQGVSDAESCRMELVRLVKLARSRPPAAAQETGSES